MKPSTVLVLLLAVFYIGWFVTELFIPQAATGFALASAVVLPAASIYYDIKGDWLDE